MKKKNKLKKKTNNKKESIFKKILKKLGFHKVAMPRTTSQIIHTFFKEFNENNSIMQLEDNLFSVCFEYQDISFAKANAIEQENIFLKWVNYLNTFSYDDHIQVVCFGNPVKTTDYKKKFVYNNQENLNENEQKVANELNNLIESVIGEKEETLCQKRYIVITTKAENMTEAQEIFLQYQLRTEEKFGELKSKIRRVNIEERLGTLYNIFHNELAEDNGINNFIKYATDNGLNVCDVLAPKEAVSFKNKKYIKVGESKFIKVMYISDLPHSVTPRFYNKVTTITKYNVIATLNITPISSAEAIKNVNKNISGMKTERLSKIKRANRNNYSYEAVMDEKLEDSLSNVQDLREALQKKKQKMFRNNFLICIQAESLDELKKATKLIKDMAGEHAMNLSDLDWQQLEGLQNCLPFGWGNLQMKRSLTSESTGVNVPFNTKDLMHENSIFYGMNLVSKNPAFIDRKKLLNGNGCVLATSRSRKIICNKIAY